MKKRIVVIGIIIIFVLALAGVGGYFIYSYNFSDRLPDNGEVFSCISTDIKEYSVFDSSGKYTLEKEDGIWHVENDKNAELDQTAVGNVISAVSKIKAISTVDRKSLENFDKSNPQIVKLEFEDADDVEITFLGTSENLCAFRISGDWRTYLMYQSTMEILTPSIDSLRILWVFPELSHVGTLPQEYSYKNYDGEVTKIREKTQGELLKGKNNRYIMEKPFYDEVDDDLFEQQIAVKIPAMRISSYIKAESAGENDYGLGEESRGELRFTWDNKTYTLYLGKNEGGTIYAMKSQAEEVFTINSSFLEFLLLDPFYLIDEGILSKEAVDILKVKIAKGDSVFDISAFGKDESMQYLINGKSANKDIFEEIIHKLEDIKFRNEFHSEPENTKDIEIVVTYKNGETQNISLTKSNDKAYAVFSGNKARFEVDSKDVDELLNTLDKVINNPTRAD